MKFTKKICAWVLAVSVLLMTIPFVALPVLAEVDVTTLDVNVTFDGNTPDPLLYTCGGANIERNGTEVGTHAYRGTIYFNAVGGYALFKTGRNSPFVTEVRRYNDAASVSIWVSADAVTWEQVTPTVTNASNDTLTYTEGQLERYTVSAIGENNQYVKVQMDGAISTLNYIRHVAFNLTDFDMTFSGDLVWTTQWTNNIDRLKQYGLHDYKVLTAGNNPFLPSTNHNNLWVSSHGELIFKTMENSAFKIDLPVYAKNVVFAVSPTGEDGTWTTPTKVVSTYTNSNNADTGGSHKILSIGEGNKYVKVTAATDKLLRISKIAFTKPLVYTVSAAANDSYLGTVTGAGTYEKGQTVTLTATPDSDCTFVKWTENDVDVSTDSTYTFTATENRNLVAVFDTDLYAVDFTDTTVFNSSNWATALPTAGVHSYSGNFLYNDQNRCLYTLYNGSQLVFRTEKNSKFKAAAWKCGNVSITFEVSPNGEDWTPVTATMVSNTIMNDGAGGWNWQIDAIGAENQYVRMTFNTKSDWHNYGRLFKVFYVSPPLATVKVSANNKAYGSITGGKVYVKGETATVTATPSNEWYRFVKWTENDVDVSTDSTYTFTAGEDRNLVAVFEEIPLSNDYTINFGDSKFVGTPNTTVNFGAFDEIGIWEYSTNMGYMPDAKVLRISNDDSYLVFRTENDSFFRVRMWKANNISVSFKVSKTGEQWTSIDATRISNSVVNKVGEETWHIDAIGQEYKFVKMVFDITDEDNAEDAFDNYARLSSVSYVRPPSATIKASANNKTYGSITGAKAYLKGETATLTATASGRWYRFVKWTENGEEVSTEATYTFTANQDRTLIAVFEEVAVPNLHIMDFSEEKYVFDGSSNILNNYLPYGLYGYSATAANEDTFWYKAETGELFAFHDAELVFRTAYNSPFRMKVVCNSSSLTFYASPTGAADSWEAVTATRIDGGYYIPAIGESNRFVKIVMGNMGVDGAFAFGNDVRITNITFELLPAHTILASANNAGWGRVDGSRLYETGETVTVTATEGRWYKFIKWTENDVEVSTEKTYTFEASKDRNLVAVFEEIPIPNLYTFDFSQSKYSSGGVANFKKLREDGLLTNTTNISYHASSKSLLMKDNGAYLVFRTEKNSIFRANAWKVGNAGITFEVSPTGLPDSWTKINATCTSNSLVNGAGDENWQIDSIGEDNQYVRMTFKAIDWENYNRLYSVSYIPTTEPGPNMYAIEAMPNKDAFGMITGVGPYTQDLDVTLIATAFEGYRFVKWTENGADIGTESSYNFKATADRVLVAVFEVDPDGEIPITDTTLDFLNNYAASVSQAFIRDSVVQPYKAGLASDVPGANIVYKMQKNSPVLAVYRIFSKETDMRPVFYASKDAKNWGEPLQYRTMASPNPYDEARMQYYIIDGIGEENVYLKIQCVDGTDFENFANFYVDLRELNFVANTDPSPFDKSLNFVTDNTALSGLYAFTPATGVEHTIERGLHLSLDHLVTKESAQKVRLIVNVDPNSGFKAQFTVNTYVEKLGLLPKLYGSKDGETWTLLSADLFKQGVTDGISNYLMYMDPQAEEYNFFAFEFQQEKDYTGIELAGLDDVVSDCLHTAVMVTNLSYLSSKTPAEKPLPDSDDEGGNGFDDPSNSPQTGHTLPIAAMVLLFLSTAAVVLSRKGKYSRLFVKR